MSLRKVLFSIGALTALLAVAPAARAQGCTTAADCGRGFTCVIVMTEPATAKTAPACAPGSICPVTDPAPTPAPDLPPQPSGTCVEAPCTTDADCGATMICHTDTIPECTGGSTCPPNAECFAPSTPPTCTTRSVSTCIYKWQLPCTADADCGDGFSCTFATGGACSGGSGTGTVGTGTATVGAPTPVAYGGAGSNDSASRSAPVPPGDTCVTTTSTIGACTPKATSCVVDVDCPGAWTCVDGPTFGTGTGIAVGAPAQGSGGAPAIAPGEPAPSGSTTPASPSKVCESPLGTFGGVATDATGAPIEMVGGGTGGAGGSKTGANPMAAGSSTSAPSSGCALGGRSSGSALAAALALLGLVVARRRR